MGDQVKYYEVSKENKIGSALVRVTKSIIGDIEQIAGTIGIPDRELSLDNEGGLEVGVGYRCSLLDQPADDTSWLGRQIRLYNGELRNVAGGMQRVK